MNLELKPPSSSKCNVRAWMQSDEHCLITCDVLTTFVSISVFGKCHCHTLCLKGRRVHCTAICLHTHYSRPIQGCISYVQDRFIYKHPLSPLATSMSFNNAPMILDLAERSESVRPAYGRRRICSEPCLSESLPTTSMFCLPVTFTDF